MLHLRKIEVQRSYMNSGESSIQTHINLILSQRSYPRAYYLLSDKVTRSDS